MASIKVSIPHRLGAEEAQRRITSLINDAKSRFSGTVTDVEESWQGNQSQFSFKAMGFPVSGRMFVEPEVVRVEIDLPFAALPFRSRIENELVTQARTLLA